MKQPQRQENNESRSSEKSKASARRVDILSRSKPIPSGFIEDRRSVYWIDRCPPTPGKDGTTVFVLTPRQEQLVRHRDVAPNYIGDRPTSMWVVSKGAKSAEASPRVTELSLARPVHQEYKHERSVYTAVNRNAMSAEPTQRLVALSVPKPHKIWATSEDTYREGRFSDPIWEVPTSAKNARCTPRIETLADAKKEPQSYIGERAVMWPVSDNAKHATATHRLLQLSRPKSSKMRKDDYDPYRVTVGAKNARATPRIEELSGPLPRKVRQKKAN